MENAWDKYAAEYEKNVFSLTKVAIRREQIIEKVCGTNVLNLGCGSEPYLNVDLLKENFNLTVSDWSEKMMIKAKEYVDKGTVADSRCLPFQSETFDTVISTNSILPDNRIDVVKMFKEVRRVLKTGGVFVAFLPSFDSCEEENQKLDAGLELNYEDKSISDTNGWQCFHTPETIREELPLKIIELKKVYLDTQDEIDQITRLYGLDTSSSFVYEYLLFSEKD